MRSMLWLGLLLLISGSASVLADGFYVIPVDRTPVKDFYAFHLGCVKLHDDIDETYGFSLSVPELAGVIQKVEVVLFISHENNADLDVTLQHANSGTEVVLFTDIGGDGNGIFVHLDDDAEKDIGSVASVTIDGGRYNPEGSATLADFKGLDASGEWTLWIKDDTSNGYSGKLQGWGLYIVD